jgi:hypothetical protein
LGVEDWGLRIEGGGTGWGLKENGWRIRVGQGRIKDVDNNILINTKFKGKGLDLTLATT